MTAALPLSGYRVIDSTVERGELCARILADLGADVVKAEPPGGSPARGLPPFAPDGTSLFFAVRNTNKRSVIAAVGSPEFDRLLAGADLWVSSEPAGSVDYDSVLARHPRLVVMSITDFGLTGPYREYVGTDDTLVAMSGMLARSGTADRPPLLTPGSLAYDSASVTGAYFALAALWQRTSTGHGQLVDLSVMQAVAQITDWSLPNYTFLTNTGGFYLESRIGSGPVYSIYPCKDGYVRMIVLSPRQWRAIRDWLGDPEVIRDDYWDSLPARMQIQADVLDPLYIELFSKYNADELADEAQRRGVVMTPVLRPDQVPRLRHFVERGTFVEAEVEPGVAGTLASGFYEIDGERVGYRFRSPAAGEHQDLLAELAEADRSAADAVPARSAAALPFAGVKVLDFGHGGVGVETGRLFAEYGADVIKVETRTYPDFIRMVSGTMTSPSFVSSSRSKRSLGANAKVDHGRELLYRMIEWADVLIENTSTGTMADLQLDAETVRRINPRLVYVSSQLMGSRGHWKDWIGYGPNTRPAAGMSYLWNFPEGGMPPGAMAIHPDHVAGRVVATGAVAALLGRERTGEGAHVETAQVETIVNFLSDYFLKESLAPGTAQPEGNRSERGAPWGVYRCAGNERWCAITVRDDADWRRLRAAIGDPEWAQSADYDTAAGRQAAHDEIDARLTEWTTQRSDREATEVLQAAGVPAGASLYPSDFVTDAHHAARGFVVEIDQPGLGRLALEGPAIEATGMPRPYIAPAPALAEHTREIAREILGLSDDEIDAFANEGALELPG